MRKSLSMFVGTVLLLPGVASATCFEDAARPYNFDPDLLRAISYVESQFNNRASNTNTDKSGDHCMMQINDWHFDRFNLTADRLHKDACLCVKVGTRILAENVRQLGSNWRAVAAYNTGPANHDTRTGRLYAQKVEKIYKMIQIIRHRKQQ